MLRKLIVLVFITILLNGCTTSLLNLPPQDNIIRMKIDKQQIQAESVNNGYYFNFQNNDNKNNYLKYHQFISQYKNNISGVYIVFDVATGYGNAEVTAQYNLILNAATTSNQEVEELKSRYRVVTIKTDANTNSTAVQFQATGMLVEFDNDSVYSAERYHWDKLGDEYRLNPPIPVKINDKTKTLSNASAIVVIPFYPLILMYGCATGSCI